MIPSNTGNYPQPVYIQGQQNVQPYMVQQPVYMQQPQPMMVQQQQQQQTYGNMPVVMGIPMNGHVVPGQQFDRRVSFMRKALCMRVTMCVVVLIIIAIVSSVVSTTSSSSSSSSST
jgi:hypothetical protein